MASWTRGSGGNGLVRDRANLAFGGSIVHRDIGVSGGSAPPLLHRRCDTESNVFELSVTFRFRRSILSRMRSTGSAGANEARVLYRIDFARPRCRPNLKSTLAPLALSR